jgi:hypothetical protein
MEGVWGHVDGWTMVIIFWDFLGFDSCRGSQAVGLSGVLLMRLADRWTASEDSFPWSIRSFSE